MYEEVWKEWQERKAMFKGSYSFYGSDGYDGKIEILEKLLNRHVEKQYLRAGEPPRTGMKDIIEYHNKLDRQYGIQIAERQNA